MHKPTIILVRPQLGENIGMVARALWNCTLTDLRLVCPRPNWDIAKAQAAASGGAHLLQTMSIHTSLESALADLHYVYATTARPRDLKKIVKTPRTSMQTNQAVQQAPWGILFGAERNGLNNQELSLADCILEIPLNAHYTSLNLAQAVLIVCYEWLMHIHSMDEKPLSYPPLEKATLQEYHDMFVHLEQELEDKGYYHPKAKKPIMQQNLRTAFLRAQFTPQEIRTLRGVIRSLSRPLRNEKSTK